jgi:ATP-dependent Clp protease ATP-binding subunit ClpC
VLYPFERFTERAERALKLAEEEAKRARHSYIGTEHLLVGLLGEEAALAAVALSNLGVEITRVRAAMRGALSNPDPRTLKQIIPTARVNKVIEMAFKEAERLHQAKLSSEHMLLALLSEGQGIGAQVLAEMGITVEKVRGELDRLRSQSRGES